MFHFNKVSHHVAGPLTPLSSTVPQSERMSRFAASASATGVVAGDAAGLRGGISSNLEGARHVVWGKLEGPLEDSSSNPYSHNDSGVLMPKKPSRMPLDDDILLLSGSSSGPHELIHMTNLQMPLSFVSASPEKPPAADQREDDKDDDLQEVQWQLQQGTAGYDNERFKQVPLDEHGLPTLIGSIGHNSSNVCQMCPLVNAGRIDPNLIHCNLCLPSLPKRKRCKDGKSQRDYYRKIREEMMAQIEASPDTFIVDSEALTTRGWRVHDESLKGKLLTRLRSHQEEQLKKKLLSL